MDRWHLKHGECFTTSCFLLYFLLYMHHLLKPVYLTYLLSDSWFEMILSESVCSVWLILHPQPQCPEPGDLQAVSPGIKAMAATWRSARMGNGKGSKENDGGHERYPCLSLHFSLSISWFLYQKNYVPDYTIITYASVFLPVLWQQGQGLNFVW